MKTKNKRIKRIKRKRTLKNRGGGAKLSTVKPPKKISPSPSSKTIKKTRFNKNPVSDEWDQSPRSPSEFYYPEDKKKTNLEIDTEDIMRINKNRKNKNKSEISMNKYIDQKCEERIEKQKHKKLHVKNQMKSKNPFFTALVEKRNKELQLVKDMEEFRIVKCKMQMQMQMKL